MLQLPAVRRAFGRVPERSGAYTLDSIYATLRSVGNCSNLFNGTTDSLVPLLLSDLNWSQVVKIVHQTKYLENKASGLSPGVFGIRAASTVLDFPPYMFGLLVNKFSTTGPGNDERTGEHASLLQRDLRSHRSYRERFSLIVGYNIGEPNHRSVFALVIPTNDDSAPPLQSQTTALLDKIQAQSSAAFLQS